MRVAVFPSPTTPDLVLSPRSIHVMRQTWSDIIWCHWPVPPESVQALLPEGLVPDLFEGTAWVGLVPFRMKNLRLPGPFRVLSTLARARQFGEVNVRTYVKDLDGCTGVWFCTLDSDHWLAVKTANVAFGLPYRYATTRLERSGDLVKWFDRRRSDNARAELEVLVNDGPSRPASQGLEQFLVERYSLYTTWCGLLLRGEVRHESWRVRTATLQGVVTETVRAAGFEVQGEAHVLSGEPVDVTVYRLKRVRLHRST